MTSGNINLLPCQVLAYQSLLTLLFLKSVYMGVLGIGSCPRNLQSPLVTCLPIPECLY